MADKRKNLIGCCTCEAWLYGDLDEKMPCDQCLADEKEINDKLQPQTSPR